MKKVFFILITIITLSVIITCRSEDKPLKVACVGASNTRGFQLPDVDKDSYPGQLQTLAGEDWEVMNFGVGGSSLMKEGRISYWETLSFKQVMEYNPDLVVIDFGWNDMKPVNKPLMEEHFVKDYTELIDRFKAMPSNPEIYIIFPPLYYSKEIDECYWFLEEFLQEIVATNDVTPINLYDPMTKEKEYFIIDLTHYSVKGCGVAAQTVYDAIQTELKK